MSYPQVSVHSIAGEKVERFETLHAAKLHATETKLSGYIRVAYRIGDAVNVDIIPYNNGKRK